MKKTFIALSFILILVGCQQEKVQELDVVITTYDPTEVGITTAKTGGDAIVNLQGLTMSELGVCWATSHNPTINDDKTSTKNVSECFVAELTNLKPDTQYYVRAYALRGTQPYYGEEKSFKTVPFPGINITTVDLSNISFSSATVTSKIESDGGVDIVERGVCWSTSPQPKITDNKKTNGAGTGEYYVQLSNLSPETEYYVCAFATNSIDTFYGNVLHFTTNSTLPIVSGLRVSGITGTAATFHATITDKGRSSISRRGFCWSTDHNPNIESDHKDVNYGTGDFSTTVQSLVPGTVYYLRAYGINSDGVGYSEEISFSTSNTVPSLIVYAAQNISNNSAILSGKVTNNGGVAISECGFCWGTTSNPTIDNNHGACGVGEGEFSLTISNLSPRTKYYYRSYAKNECGYGYSEVGTFTTLDKPTVGSVSITDVKASRVSASSVVSDNGGDRIINKGFCWSNNANPSIDDSHVELGDEASDFSSTITGLTPNTKYYIRAYAANSFGLSYGDVSSFTTKDGKISLSSNGPNSLTATSVSIGGTINDDGGADVLQRGVCWSSQDSPTTSSETVYAQVNNNSFSCAITSLSRNTTYFARPFAINEYGTYYGQQISFTTKDGIVKLTTSEATDIVSNGATCGGVIQTDGGDDIIERGVCWATSSNPTTSGSHTSSQNSQTTFSCSITGLSKGSTYYIRAYAKNSFGTYYGNQIIIMARPTGSLPGLFSVSSNKKVFFSQGNLQFLASTKTWRFAENQTDYIGKDNEQLSEQSGKWIDMFLYGSSGYNEKYPWIPYRYAETCIESTYYDWGIYNSISNGGNSQRLWRTPTAEEWDYLIYRRENASSKRSPATVNNITGYIILPDTWTTPSGISFTSDATNFITNVYDDNQWKSMSQQGALFLPASGYRDGVSNAASNRLIMKNIGVEGAYYSTWFSSTPAPYANYFSKVFDFTMSEISIKQVSFYHMGYGSMSYSVRLIQDF